MKRVPALVLLALTVTAFGALAGSLVSLRNVDSSETAALKSQVAGLQQRLAALEARVEEINKPRLHRTTAGDEVPVRSDRLEPSVIDRAARERESLKPPNFPAERP